MIEVYCDESRQDLLTSKLPKHDRYALIGSLWLTVGARELVADKFKALRNKHSVFGEIKWSKVLNPSKKEFFIELIDLFFEIPDARFRCICIDSYLIDNNKYNDGDGELGFYKFYYQALYHWINNESYRIFCDIKLNQNRNRLKDLHRTLLKTTNSDIEFIQPLRSSQTPMLQICDFLLGLTSAKTNDSVAPGTLKAELIQTFEDRLGHAIGPTLKTKTKYNVFYIKLKRDEE